VTATDPRLATLLSHLKAKHSDPFDEQELTRFRQIFETLPVEEREVVLLARVEGCSHEEIALRHGIAEEQSRRLLAQAVVRLGQGLRPG
jgi:RNA polymerase sigma factor (sigma-70 family)